MARKQHTVKHPIQLAIDAGNGTTKVISERTDPIIFPSVIQQTEDVRLDGRGSQGFTIHIDPMWQDNAQAVRKSYAIGDTAILLPGLQQRITSKDRIGSEYQLVLILAGTAQALADLYKTPEITARVEWILNTPPLYYSLSDRLYDLAGEYRIEYGEQVFNIAATVFHVHPEGAGAGAAYMLDSNGQFVNPQFASGHTGIVDPGYRTVDYAIFQGAQLLENSAGSLANSITGVYQLAQRWALDEFGEDWNENETETNLRRGYCILRESKEQIPLDDWLTELGGRLADLIDQDVFQKEWNGLGDVDRVILAGGVAYMVADHLKDRYPAVIHLRDEYPHVANIGYELLNATGHIRLLQAQRLNA